MPGFFTDLLSADDKRIEISGDEFHHLTRVFRKQTGDEVLLSNGQGVLATGINYY